MASKHVLVPMDGSPSALRALEFACERYRDSPHVCLLVLNVQSPLPRSSHVTRAMITEYHTRLSEAALQPARKVIERRKMDAQCYVRTGEIATQIASFARRTRCREIIMGTRGLSRISGLLLGSVATKVIHLAHVPVTLVK